VVTVGVTIPLETLPAMPALHA
jgi:hypothetical protein